MQEIIQGNRRYYVSYEFDLDLIKRVSKDCGSESVKSSPSYLSALRYWSGDRFWGFSVDEVCYLFSSFSKKHFRLSEIAVDKEHQHQGYGKLAINLLFKECAKRKIHKITLRTSQAENAYKWYQSLGAQIVGINKNDYEMEFVL